MLAGCGEGKMTIIGIIGVTCVVLLLALVLAHMFDGILSRWT